MSISSRRFSLLPLFAMVAVSAACSDTTAPGASLSPEGPNFAVTFDPTTGTGFVGKGDVQLVYSWNNKALQDNAHLVQVRVNSEVVTEVSWICTNSHNENIQERERTTTTTIQGVVTTVARERNQITGFNLTGYIGTPTESTTTEGQKFESCPSGADWSLTTPAGDPEVVSSTGGLQVSINSGTNWFDL